MRLDISLQKSIYLWTYKKKIHCKTQENCDVVNLIPYYIDYIDSEIKRLDASPEFCH